MKLQRLNNKLFTLFTIILSGFVMKTTLATNALHSLQNKYLSCTEAGQGEALVLIHAFPTDKDLWQPQQQGLADYFNVVTLDLWGFGQSESPKPQGEAITMSEYADQINQMLDELHIKKAIIGGESMGGYIALAFLQKYPEKVSGLLLSNTQAIADTTEAKAKRESTAQEFLQHGTTPFIEGFLPKALSIDATTEQVNHIKEILLRQTPTAMASALRGMALREDLSAVLSKTQTPILIITSDKDAVISPQQSINMHALAKNSTLVTLEKAGHLSSWEHAELWNKAVVERFFRADKTLEQ